VRGLVGGAAAPEQNCADRSRRDSR
jgi:hypothetical protein